MQGGHQSAKVPRFNGRFQSIADMARACLRSPMSRLTHVGNRVCIAAVETLIFAEGGEQSSRGAFSFDPPVVFGKPCRLLSATPSTVRPRTNVSVGYCFSAK